MGVESAERGKGVFVFNPLQALTRQPPLKGEAGQFLSGALQLDYCRGLQWEKRAGGRMSATHETSAGAGEALGFARRCDVRRALFQKGADGLLGFPRA